MRMRFASAVAVIAVIGGLLAGPAYADTAEPSGPPVTGPSEPGAPEPPTDTGEGTPPNDPGPDVPAPADPADPTAPDQPEDPGAPGSPDTPLDPVVPEPGTPGGPSDGASHDDSIPESDNPDREVNSETDHENPTPTWWIPPTLDFGPDPKVAQEARDKLKQVREQLAQAEEELEQAQQDAETAQAAAQEAAWQALLAQVRAEQAQRVLNQYASGVYRSGGGVPSLVRIVDGSLEDPAAVLDEEAYLEQASRLRASQVEQARLIVAEADQAEQASQEAQLQAQQAVRTAELAQERLVEKLAQARAELDQVLAMPAGVQTLIGPNGCPTTVPEGTLRGAAAEVDPYELCRRSVTAAATPEAALAIKYLFRALGAPYACDGIGRTEPYRYDCSSLAARAYAEGAGLGTAGPGWSPSSRDMVPWDGVPLGSHYYYVSPKDARPGDLFLYDTGGASYRHVVIMMADGFMIHTNSCGDVAKVETFWGAGVNGAQFLVARRVMSPETAARLEPAGSRDDTTSSTGRARERAAS